MDELISILAQMGNDCSCGHIPELNRITVAENSCMIVVQVRSMLPQFGKSPAVPRHFLIADGINWILPSCNMGVDGILALITQPFLYVGIHNRCVGEFHRTGSGNNSRKISDGVPNRNEGEESFPLCFGHLWIVMSYFQRLVYFLDIKVQVAPGANDYDTLADLGNTIIGRIKYNQLGTASDIEILAKSVEYLVNYSLAVNRRSKKPRNILENKNLGLEVVENLDVVLEQVVSRIKLHSVLFPCSA